MSVTASAQCPKSAKVNENVTLMGSHSWAVENKSDKPVKVTVEVRIEDNDKHRFSQSDDHVIKAHDTLKGKSSSRLVAAYTKPLTVQLKATTRVTGGISETRENSCSFKVQ
jgi:hypothetical protein